MAKSLRQIRGASPQEVSKYYGIYRAKCLNNNDPRGQGRILVHIYVRDGRLNYEEQSHQWIPVLSPYGGLSGMGLFMIPPIHADGFVIFEAGDTRKPVWIGAYPFAPTREVDSQASQRAGYAVIKTTPTVPIEMGGDYTKIILKTQYPPQSDPDITSDTNTIENVILMDETKLELFHVNQSSYEYKEGGVSSSDSSSFIRLLDQSVEIGVKTSDGKTYAIQVTADGIRFSSNLGDYIQISDGRIQIVGTDAAQIKIEAKENGSVTIDSKNTVLDGESIILGPPGAAGGAAVVTTQSICPFVGFPVHQGSTKVMVSG
jgi:hypothetical protein